MSDLPMILRRHRERRGWSLERLSSESGVSKAFIWNVEQGRSVPSVAVAQKLATALSISVGDLLGEAEGVSMPKSAEPHCLLCDDHFREQGETCWGLRLDVMPGRVVYLCWECAIWLEQRLHAHVNNYAYGYLFDRRRRRRPVQFLRFLEEAALPVDEVRQCLD